MSPYIIIRTQYVKPVNTNHDEVHLYMSSLLAKSAFKKKKTVNKNYSNDTPPPPDY